MGRRDRRYLERTERALYAALAAGNEQALAAATARLDAAEPRDEDDRVMRARLLAVAHTREATPPVPRQNQQHPEASWLPGTTGENEMTGSEPPR
jgi:hypothetical protein